MAYIAPLHQPSGVRTAVKLNLLDPDESSLVVAKSNCLEIYRITADGIVLQYTRYIYGSITLLTKLRPPDSETDLLLVGTDRYAYSVLSWDPVSKQLTTAKAYVDLADKLARPSQSIERAVIDPAGRVLVLEIFEGTLTVIPLYSKGKGKNSKEEWTLGTPEPFRITERFVRSLCFMHNREIKVSKQPQKPRLAILYDDGAGDCRRVIQALDHTSGDVGFTKENTLRTTRGDVDYTASHIIPVEHPVYGSLILSEASITYWNNDGEKTSTHALQEATIWATWTRVDANRWLLADEYGSAYFLALVLEDEGFGQGSVSGLRLNRLGGISTASVLVYLDAGYFYVGSKTGDSQVIRIDEQGEIDEVQNLPGIAPISDFTIMDMGNRSGEGQVNEYSSGQARIVTGSGAFENGSLRSIRSGVGVEELGSLGGIEHVMNLFPIRSSPAAKKFDTLVASFANETRVFHFSDEGVVEEAESFNGLILNDSTILAQTLMNGKIVQVTATTVQLVDLESGMVEDTFLAHPKKIEAATMCDTRLVLSLDGSDLVTLNLDQSLKVRARTRHETDLQASCLHVSSLAPKLLFVGFWKSSMVRFYDVDTLQILYEHQVSDESSSVPRSLVLAQLLLGQSPTLIIALADGSVLTLEVNVKSHSMTNAKSTILGTQQASLHLLPRPDGIDSVFAACENSSLIYGADGRLIFSAVTADATSCVCPFDSEPYPGAIAIASSEDLKIALIDNKRRTDVQTLSVGETVRRIVYLPSHKAFALGCIQRQLLDGAEIIQSSLKLVDEVVFGPLHSYDLQQEEIIESVIRAPLAASTGQITDRIVVGTAYIGDESEDSVKGRILLFEVSPERGLVLLTEQKTKSACKALAVVEGKIAAALVKTLVIYSVEHNVFEKIATTRTATIPIDLCVNGNVIGVGDLMKSLSIVRFISGEAGENGKLEEIARHFQTAWTTSIAEIEENTYLESDAEGNLIVLRRNIDGVTDDDRRRLETISEFSLGEMVNKIRPISVTTSAGSAVIPKAFIATVEGSLYLFCVIREEKQNLLMTLQSNMAKHVKTPGMIPFQQYRAYHSLVRDADEPFRFVDGQLIESYLDFDEDTQKALIHGLDVPLAEVKIMIENLRRMH